MLSIKLTLDNQTPPLILDFKKIFLAPEGPYPLKALLTIS